jgi:tetratricopeptide (TPR) repeat protein
VPLVVFGSLELGLRVGGYGHTTRFFLDGSKLERPGVVIDNRAFGRWAFPQGLNRTPYPVPFVLSTEKKPGTYRVFVLGESAAMGFPEPAFAFGRILEAMLRARYPATQFEVVNAAMTAINSHIVLSIARECADHEPNLFVVHVGNNEVVGPFGAAGVLGPHSASRRAIRANLAIRRTRTGQLFSSLVNQLKGGDASPQTWNGMTMFVNSQVRADDKRLPRTYDHFRENLRDICRVGSDAGVPVVVCTIPVNLKDSAPFGSLHAPDLSPEQTAAWDAAYAEGQRLETTGNFADAVARYQEAVRIDGSFADLVFHLARCLAAQGIHAEARQAYLRARDLDTLRFRSDVTINAAIREIAAEHAGDGVHLADAERAFEEASPENIPGEEFFLEHVHMNFGGNYLLARTVFQTITPLLDVQLPGGERTEPVNQEECATRLAYTDWNELQIVGQVQSNLLRQPPFTGQLDREARNIRWEAKAVGLHARLDRAGLQHAADVHQKASEMDEADWMIRMNYGQLLTELRDFPQAEEQFRSVLRSFRHNLSARCELGQVMLLTGRIEAAETDFHDALQMAPDHSEARLGMAEVLGAQGKVDEGLAIYEEQLSQAPDRAGMLTSLGAYLLKAGRFEDAKGRLEEALQLDPDNPLAYVYLGATALKQGQRMQAIDHYEAALKLRPDWTDLRNQVTQLKSEPGKAPKK